jgi:tetratricopeptide (TPR) repeat protein
LLGGALLAALVLGAPAGRARADTPPSPWDRAREPGLGESYRLHVEIQRRLAVRDRFEIGAADANLRTARAMLERALADKSPDPRLRFDLGLVYLRLEEHAKARAVLLAALAELPDHPAADEAWLRLAFACGHLGDHECERRSYLQVLQRTTEELSRSTPILNLAETEMHLGNLREAIDGYREALRIAGRVPSGDTGPLAVWGLAVALDRSGDRVGGEREARFAHELSRSIGKPELLRSPDVFFVPSYEVHWYEGLGAAALAKQATSGSDIVRLWRAAEMSYGAYVRFGEMHEDRWLDLAKLRLANAKGERERAERKYGREPPREADEERRL